MHLIRGIPRTTRVFYLNALVEKSNSMLCLLLLYLFMKVYFNCDHSLEDFENVFLKPILF